MEVHIANLAVFPYAVHFIIDNDAVIVLAVLHVAIDPDKWKQRLSPALDKQPVLHIIDGMLTKTKFEEFFQKNVSTL